MYQEKGAGAGRIEQRTMELAKEQPEWEQDKRGEG